MSPPSEAREVRPGLILVELLAVDGAGRRGAFIGAASAVPPVSTGVNPASSINRATTRLASSSSPHTNMTTRSGPVRPAACS
ncbi:MAG TPA: hypothetical protein VH834_04660 [Solirubrobacteraceae bacterium]